MEDIIITYDCDYACLADACRLIAVMVKTELETFCLLLVCDHRPACGPHTACDTNPSTCAIIWSPDLLPVYSKVNPMEFHLDVDFFDYVPKNVEKCEDILM